MTINERVRETFQKGYRVLEDGQVRSPFGVTRVLDADTAGYSRFTVKCSDGCIRGIPVHKLAAYQRYGEGAFASGLEVRHLDNDHTNNALTNIGIGTHSQNLMDAPAEVRRQRAYHASPKKLSEAQVQSLLEDRAGGMTYKELGMKYGIVKSSISYIIHSRSQNLDAGTV